MKLWADFETHLAAEWIATLLLLLTEFGRTVAVDYLTEEVLAVTDQPLGVFMHSGARFEATPLRIRLDES